jgi:iron-sulfur cluster assembly accessory protein
MYHTLVKNIQILGKTQFVKFFRLCYNSNMILTEKAKQKVSELIGDSRISIPDREIFLRISVQPGGCSGLRYQTFFDYEKLEGDTDYNFEDFTLKLDRMSVPYLQGATLDFVDTIEKQGFVLDNPNAQGSCACGDSFN